MSGYNEDNWLSKLVDFGAVAMVLAMFAYAFYFQAKYMGIIELCKKAINTFLLDL